MHERLLEALRGSLELVATEGDEFPVHVSHTVELRRDGLVVRFVTGWSTSIELLAGELDGVAVGDRIHALDWGIDNSGPEGAVIAFNGEAFVLEGNGYVPEGKLVPEAGDRARAFARAVVGRVGASSLQELVQAVARFADPADHAARWRLGNLAAATEQGTTVRWSEREKAFVTSQGV